MFICLDFSYLLLYSFAAYFDSALKGGQSRSFSKVNSPYSNGHRISKRLKLSLGRYLVLVLSANYNRAMLQGVLENVQAQMPCTMSVFRQWFALISRDMDFLKDL